ncbi:PLDc N-terminal domain-containing protein [Wenzhouxiangella marina]|uniref:Cardiolipin synthase N-terminal domain-containing protein n=1 Tax=Wenzhouxiangella marina TaxID=1579979 RepID=A0A0K0XSH4_9GAMM|nr:PLDc N-terminal domain-containing protein [Wenzhouxiangella marina]AKS40572.1 hypothetical protein WM2015_183 [Wenzhouxiangella marina]MBB6088340.1 hypothetical protein [Wenzhouxiangella marina]
MGLEMTGLFGLGALGVSLLSVIWLIVVIWAIIKTAQSHAGGVSKFLWILILILFPVLGLIFWLLLGPKR